MKKTMFNSRLLSCLAPVLASLALLSCAPQQQPTTKAVDRMSAMMSAGVGGAGAESVSWNCPSQPNVNLLNHATLYGTYSYDGSEDFTVCTPFSSSRNGTIFKATGATASRALCFYPMNASSTTAPQLVAAPMCYDVTGGALILNFSNPTAVINYLVVVDANYTTSHNKCLSSSSPCPAHSEGFIQ